MYDTSISGPLSVKQSCKSIILNPFCCKDYFQPQWSSLYKLDIGQILSHQVHTGAIL